MSRVVDASVLVAALADTGPAGQWSEATLAAGDLWAPHLLMAETSSILRRLRASGQLAPGDADAAFRHLLELPVELVPFEPFAERIWQLKENVTSYDAWYVAIAEALDLPLATLDLRLAGSPGVRCRFETPPDNAP